MSGRFARPDPAIQPRLRLDKWLWHARFFKTRALSGAMVVKGRCRINGQRCTKAGHGLAVGDVLGFAQGNVVRLVRVLALGDRRGPAAEAQALYADLALATPLE